MEENPIKIIHKSKNMLCYSKLFPYSSIPSIMALFFPCPDSVHLNIRQCPAEELPFASGEVDLLSAMTAAHWFDHQRFLKEADRVLKPGGCLALLSYTMDMELEYGDISSTLNDICKEVHPKSKSSCAEIEYWCRFSATINECFPQKALKFVFAFFLCPTSFMVPCFHSEIPTLENPLRRST